MNYREFGDLVEFYAGRAGVVGDSIDRKLLLALTNAKLAEIYNETNYGITTYTFETTSATYEYDLPEEIVPYKVSVESIMIERTDYETAREWRYDE